MVVSHTVKLLGDRASLCGPEVAGIVDDSSSGRKGARRATGLQSFEVGLGRGAGSDVGEWLLVMWFLTRLPSSCP